VIGLERGSVTRLLSGAGTNTLRVAESTDIAWAREQSGSLANASCGGASDQARRNGGQQWTF
jgi:hypothetical protein